MPRSFNVLFLCTGNSARSILGEVLLKHWGRERFNTFSAGSFPKGDVNPMALELLRSLKLPTEGLRSKSWNEFATPDSPVMDFVITVCDQAASEVCPIRLGQPITAHWGVPDPAAAEVQKNSAWLRSKTPIGALTPASSSSYRCLSKSSTAWRSSAKRRRSAK